MTLDSPGRAGGPNVLGHRGGDGGPQNSLDAIRAAIEIGADGVEIDVQVSPDGDVVVGHDLLDWSRVPEPGQPPSLRLGELLPVVEQAGIALLLDVKSGGDPSGEATALVDVLTTASRPELITVSSFSVPFLERFRQLAPGFPLVPIVSIRQNFPGPNPADGWAGVSVLAAALMANPLLALGERRRGGRLLVWFAATEWTLVVRAAIRLGADDLIVSDVGRILSLLGRRRAAGPR